ncbi:unnamed protein product [Effrenium voratum]|nr:unnamed protein product [Effrenium voratum]
MGAGTSGDAAQRDCQACQEPSTSRPSRPPSREEIGRAAWRYVHCLAANYPEQPEAQDQVSALVWLRSFLRLYPCRLCSQEFIDVCRDLPPRLPSRDEYALWWCEAHNRVRVDLSQPPRRCELRDLLQAGLAGLTLSELSARCTSSE